jgi:hypothetical protein
MERQRPVHIDQEIPEFLWGETFHATIHITNRVATLAVDGKTLYEAFMDDIEPGVDYKPSVSHIRVLGCKVYVLIEKERRVTSRKLAPRADVGILVGFEGNSIYRVYMPSRARDKIIRTSHARFDEGGFITEPDFEAIDDENLRLQQNKDVESNPLSLPPNDQSQNKDVERIRDDHRLQFEQDGDDSNDEFFETEEDVTLSEVPDDDGEHVDVPDISLQNTEPPAPKKRGRPKGSTNKKKTDDTPTENKRVTRSKNTVAVTEHEVDEYSDKGRAYYEAFLAGLETPTDDPTTL